MMDISTMVNLALCILSFILAAISVWTVIATLRQNNKMIEESTRPVLAFYTSSINTGSPTFYFVVRNYGSSSAIIEKIVSDKDFTTFLLGNDLLEQLDRFDPIRSLQNATIAPGQSRICALDFNKTPDEIKINVEYKSNAGKKYKEEIIFSPKAGVDMLTVKSPGKKDNINSTLEKISYTLQELLQKKL